MIVDLTEVEIEFLLGNLDTFGSPFELRLIEKLLHAYNECGEDASLL